jgi:hypothetical protein
LRHPVVHLVNQSTVVDDAWTDAVAVALQQQVSLHFGPRWGIDARVVRDKVRGAWRLVVLDDSDQAGALGYHDLTNAGKPQGLVFAKTDHDAGLSASVTVSHELLEMLADPWINLTAIDPQSQRAYAYETCDAVEADALGYEIDGILVSNFVLPAYFQRDGAGPYDYKGVITAPFSLAQGGYMSYLTSLSGGWHQVFAAEAPVRRGAERREQRQRALHGQLRRSTR